MRRLWQCAALILPAVALLATASRPAPVAAATAGPTPSCQRPAVAGTVTEALRSGRVSRHLRLYVPPGLPVQGRLPVVLDLHGSGSTAAAQQAAGGMDATARAHGFLVAYPQGSRRSGTGYAWNVPGTALPAGPASHVDDLRYLRDVVAQLVDRYCADPDRVFATGFSGGGRMSSALACSPDTPLAAVAPVGGLRAPQPCHPGHPVAVVAFHGVADPVNLYAGHGPAYWTYSVPEAAQRWAGTNHCAGPAVTTHPLHGVTVTTYTGCPTAAAVLLYALAGVGHRWPRPVAGAAPPTPATLNVDEIMWSLFAAVSAQPPAPATSAAPSGPLTGAGLPGR
jgi:polyhydroxybutyrate depolymerase